MIPKFRAYINKRVGMIWVKRICFYPSFIDFEWENEIGITQTYSEDLDKVKLMQSTGVKDTNGVEIFEGDIVKFDARSHYRPEVYAWEYETKGVGITRYEMGSYVLEGREEAHILESLFGMLMNYEEVEMEVIGNIWEDPELLEVEE